MKNLIYIVIKSIIQGLYKGTLFFSALFSLVLLSAFFSRNYFFISALGNAFNFNNEFRDYLLNINFRMWIFYWAIVIVSMILVTIKNIIERKK
ncbi:TPA: hypothetical protein ACSTJZ_003188 [Serratia fonticola]